MMQIVPQSNGTKLSLLSTLLITGAMLVVVAAGDYATGCFSSSISSTSCRSCS